MMFGLCFCPSRAWGLRPGIPRVTWATDHFTLTIDEKKQDLLPKLAALAEECYGKESAYFGFSPPGHIQMVFLDEGDYANGFAYAPEGWVVIHMHSAEHLLRGRTRWLPNVMSHEIGHIFTLRRMGEDSRFLGVDAFHTWRGRSGSTFDESFTWRYGQVPPWLAEGLAQYAAAVCGYDTLDTHRQMLLHVAASSGSLLSLAELKAFAWDGRRNEMIYAQGYALVTYLYQTFGPKAANHYLELSATEGWRGACKPAFGKSLEAIYQDWRKGLEAASRAADNSGDGDFPLPEPPGPYTVESFPVPLSGGAFLYLSSGDNDHAQTDLYLADGKGKSSEVFSRATSIAPGRDGHSALFTATRYAADQADVVSELYAYAGKAGKEGEDGEVQRLTTGGRILRGCQSGGTVYGIRNNEGRTSIVQIAGGDWTTVYTPPDSMEITDLVAGPAPGSLTLGTTSGFGADLRELDIASGELSPLADSPQEELDPIWRGDTLYFSADYGGTFDIYALVDEQVTRLTRAAGGAFHPCPREDGLWVSAYGPKGFRLARMKPLGEEAPPFVVELPVPGWKAPTPVEYEADAFDRTSLGLLGFNVTLGIIRSPGFRDSSFDTASGNLSSSFSYGDGTRALTAISFFWQNPGDLAEANVQLGLTRPLDYPGPMHLDATSFAVRVNAFLPTLVAGGDYATFDLPDVKADGTRFIFYDGSLTGYAGMEMQFSDYWAASVRADVANDFGFRGEEGEKVNDSDPHFGGTADLAYANLEHGKDGVTRGFSAFLRGEMVPKVNPHVPDYSATAGATLNGSVRRALFLEGNLYHTEDFGDRTKRWIYGNASAYGVIPLGMQLGTRGGAGVFLDQVQPGIEYRNMSRLTTGTGGGGGSSLLPTDSPLAAEHGLFQPGTTAMGYSPRAGGLHALIDRRTSHEAGMTLSLKTISFFARPERWTAGLFFNVVDFGSEPVWSVSVSL